MRVVQFVYGLNMGGVETLVKDYSLYLRKIDDVEVTILCFKHLKSPYEEYLENANVNIIYLDSMVDLKKESNLLKKIKDKILLYRAVKRELHRLNPDVVHIHLTLTDYVRYAKLSKDTKIVYTQHFQVQTWKEKYAREIRNLRWIIKHYHTQIIAINEKMKKELDSLLGVSNTIVLRNCVNIQKLQNAKNSSLIRAELGINNCTFLVGHVGRFSDVKNQLFLLDVFAEIQKIINDSKLLLVGSGDFEKKIIEKSKSLGIHEKVIILHNRTDINDLLHAMDIFVFPSKSEGLGIAVIEAQIARVKCLASTELPSETRVSNYIDYLSLKETAKEWADKGIQLFKENKTIKYYGIEKWDINCVVKDLYNIYNCT